MRRSLTGIVGTGVLTAVVLAVPAGARAQDPGGQAGPQGSMRGQFAGAQRVAGEVVSVSGPNITVKNLENGQTVTVVTTTNTRMMRGQGETLDLSTLKTGEGVMAMGQMDAPAKSLHTVMVMGMTADQTRQMVQAAAQLKANLGKTYITGRVTALDLDNLKMTVQRPDGEAQTIGFDEGTSFKKGGQVIGIGGGMMFGGGRRGGAGAAGAPNSQASGGTPAITGGESITLADIKVGDNVVGLGTVKAGTFVPSMLNVQVRGEGGRRGSGQGPSGASGQPAGAQPVGPGGPQAK